jgi:hypothetical protein
MNSTDYETPENLWKPALIEHVLEAQEAVIRLDERVRRSPLRDGWMQRMLFSEACACQLAEGDLVHMEDLVLLDNRTYKGPGSIPLSSALHTLQTWRAALQADARSLLRAPQPGMGEAPAPPPGDLRELDTRDSDTEALARRLAEWRRVVRETDRHPPLLAAAVVWDAWTMLDPEPHGAWRAPLLAALMLKSRGTTTSLLLPIDTGRRHAEYRRHPAHGFTGRMIGFLTWVEAAAGQGMNALDRLALAEEQLSLKLRTASRNSHLPELAALFLSRPLVTIPMAAAHHGISHQAVERLLPQLGSTPRELTGRKRFRAWAVG